jgi:CheY-like chemotaxis protein
MASILVIDDSQSSLELAQQMLAGAGHKVYAFLSAREAMEMVARTPVDLIITDIYMPDKDGLEVIADARKHCPKTPILAVSSALGGRNMLPAARILGATHTLLKPFSKQELLNMIAQSVAPLSPAAAPQAARRD